jgi:hypothetical protein
MVYGGLVGVERNNTGHAVLLRLIQLWKEEAVKVGAEKMPYHVYGEDGKPGFPTNELTRTIGIQEFDEALRGASVKLAHEDVVGIGEARAWHYNAKMKEAAPSGGHDDTVLAKIIAFQMRKWSSRREGTGPKVKKSGRARIV